MGKSLSLNLRNDTGQAGLLGPDFDGSEYSPEPRGTKAPKSVDLFSDAPEPGRDVPVLIVTDPEQGDLL